jgi:diaminopropionate ammonia-lyase
MTTIHTQKPQGLGGRAPAALSERASSEVHRWISAILDPQPSPLVSLPTLAAQLGVGAIAIKDEGARLGLRSFKALGGAYAVFRLAYARAVELGLALGLEDLPRSPSGSLDYPAEVATQADTPKMAAFREVASGMTFACATDGNHGQSVAAGARLTGARAVIFVHEGVSQMRRDAIARFGAEIREVRGSYDDAVAEALAQADANGWTLLSDTSWPGYEDIPMFVMQGYTLMTREIAQQLDAPPTHVFLQAGVGGFAAALAVSMAEIWGESAPRIIVVEPDRAACLLASAREGRRVRIEPGEETLMSMLECYEPSLTAWELLAPLASAFVAVTDAQAVGAMRTLALKLPADETVLSGESGAAGLAGLLTVSGDAIARRELGLDETSRVLLVNSESATDPARYFDLVGVASNEVARRIQRRPAAGQLHWASARSTVQSPTPSHRGASHDR